MAYERRAGFCWRAVILRVGPESRQRIAHGVSGGSESCIKISPAPEGRQTMDHTFTNLRTHVIFSTQDRLPLLTLDLREDMLAYLGASFASGTFGSRLCRPSGAGESGGWPGSPRLTPRATRCRPSKPKTLAGLRNVETPGKGQASPHIRRQSRFFRDFDATRPCGAARRWPSAAEPLWDVTFRGL